MYTYCLNNPIIHADSCGTDACIVIDDDGAIGFGHIGFLVEDDEGQWWHFYWGPQNGLIPIIGIDVQNASWCVEYDGEISLEAINESGQYGETYDRMIYLLGNFSDCIDVAKSLDSKYNLYNNNCSHVSLGTLSKANTPYKDQLDHAATFCIIPKCAFRYLENTCKTITPRGCRGRDMLTVLD